jgi:hypothetical protein
VPVGADEAVDLGASPGLGVPGWAWPHLVAVAAASSREGGLLVWQRWQRAAANLRLVRAALAQAQR